LYIRHHHRPTLHSIGLSKGQCYKTRQPSIVYCSRVHVWASNYSRGPR
jgi:hypothetical protein